MVAAGKSSALAITLVLASVSIPAMAVSIAMISVSHHLRLPGRVSFVAIFDLILVGILV